MHFSTNFDTSNFMDVTFDSHNHKIFFPKAPTTVPFDIVKIIYSFVEDTGVIPKVCQSWRYAYIKIQIANSVREQIFNTLPILGKQQPMFIGRLEDGKFLFHQASLQWELAIEGLQSTEQKEEQEIEQVEQQLSSLNIQSDQPESCIHKDRLLFSVNPYLLKIAQTSVTLYDLAIYDKALSSGWRYDTIKSAIDKRHLLACTLKEIKLDDQLKELKQKNKRLA